MSNSIFDKTTDALGSSIDFRSMRQNITSANIANAETPGYKAKVVDFEDALARAIDLEGWNKGVATDKDDFLIGGGAISRARADVYDNPDVNVSNDGNTVDMEREMATLQENTILYKAALNLINKKLGAIRYAVTEGGR
jgi:flagellar basal-body rod protein FlgB